MTAEAAITTGVTTRDAAPRISRWGDRVAMTAGNPRGYERFYAPSLEPRLVERTQGALCAARGDDSTPISRGTGHSEGPRARVVLSPFLSYRTGR